MVKKHFPNKGASHIFWQAHGLPVTLMLLAAIGLGFMIRLQYLMHKEFHPDEFISMLAASGVTRTGLPIMPSGLLYNSELAFSFLGGGLMRVMGVSEFPARWVGLWFGVLLIPVAYATANRIFSSPYAGVTAAWFFTVAPEVVLWGARARRYSMIQLLILVIILLAWLGVINADRRKYRIILYLVTFLASFVGILIFIVMPPLVLAALVLAWRLYAPRGIPRRDIILELGMVLLVVAGLLLQVQNDFIGQHSAESKVSQQAESDESSSVTDLFTRITPFLVPDFSLSAEAVRLTKLAIAQPIYPLLVGFGVVTLMLSLLPGARQWPRRQKATWYLTILAAGVLLEFVLLVSEQWKSNRYLLGGFWPVLAILAAGLPVWLLWPVTKWWSTGGPNPNPQRLGVVLSVVVIMAGTVVALPETISALSRDLIEDNSIYQAIQYIKTEQQGDEKIATTTTMPPVAYWYLGRSDYYIRMWSPYLFENDRGETADIWTGARWIHTTDQLTEVFSAGQPLWLVIDDKRLFEQLPLSFQQQVFANMALRLESEKISVFQSRTDPVSVPTAPENHLDVQMLDRLRLIGFSLTDEETSVQLTLFWKVLQPLPFPNGRVFVHLRNEAGETVYQADHIPSESIRPIPLNNWRVGETIPDVSLLEVPADSLPGTYTLLVGIYDPETQQRLPVENDITGENAVVLGEYEIR
jgi:hypothetical protein